MATHQQVTTGLDDDLLQCCTQALGTSPLRLVLSPRTTLRLLTLPHASARALLRSPLRTSRLPAGRIHLVHLEEPNDPQCWRKAALSRLAPSNRNSSAAPSREHSWASRYALVSQQPDYDHDLSRSLGAADSLIGIPAAADSWLMPTGR